MVEPMECQGGGAGLSRECQGGGSGLSPDPAVDAALLKELQDKPSCGPKYMQMQVCWERVGGVVESGGRGGECGDVVESGGRGGEWGRGGDVEHVLQYLFPLYFHYPPHIPLPC